MPVTTVETCTDVQNREPIKDTLRRYSAKHLARWTGRSVSAAEKWRTGDRVPSADTLLTLMRRNDEIMSRLLGRPIE